MSPGTPWYFNDSTNISEKQKVRIYIYVLKLNNFYAESQIKETLLSFSFPVDEFISIKIEHVRGF